MSDGFDLLDQLSVLGRPDIQQKPWMIDKKMSRVTVDTIDRVIDECITSGLYALDLETTGLDTRVFDGCTASKIVGCCLSPDGVSGYYIPVRHKIADSGESHPANVPWTRFEASMRRLLDSPAVAIFHNGKFDQELLQFNGGDSLGDWDDINKWEDTLILTYLLDSRARRFGLKPTAKALLDMEMVELRDLYGPAHKGPLDFSLLDPTWDPAIWYGCSDAICTYLLFKKIHEQVVNPNDRVKGQTGVYKIEKLCVIATRWMERARIKVDRKKIWDFIQPGQKEYFDALSEVYASASELLGRDITPASFRLFGENLHLNDPDCLIDVQLEEARNEAKHKKLDPTEDHKGKTRIKTIRKSVPTVVGKGMEDIDFQEVYDVLSPEQLGLLFRELGVKGLTVTEKSGQVKTTKAELERLIDDSGDEFPFMSKIRRFREAHKALSTYLYPLYRDCNHSGNYADDSVKIDFLNFGTDTGRFSAPGGDPEHGGTSYPFQGTPSPDKPAPFYLKRIRECIIPRPRKKLVAIDCSGVELRIVTNLSRETKWIDEFFRCADCGMTFDRGSLPPPPPEAPPPFCPKCGSDKIGDLHTLTALNIYGKDSRSAPDWKDKRKHGKMLNFALCYGGGHQAAMRAVGCDKNEGFRIKKQYDGTYTGLFAWWRSQKEFGKKHGFVLTAYGRRYPVPDINMPEELDPVTKRDKNGGFRSKAERNAVNSPIQGTSADITKLAMGLVYQECRKRGWLDKVHMIATVHDELVFEIDDDILEEAVEALVECMAKRPVRNLAWIVPITVDVEMGPDWSVPWNLNEILRSREWPAELIPLFPNLYAQSMSKKPLDVDAPPPLSERDDETETTVFDGDDDQKDTGVEDTAIDQAEQAAQHVVPSVSRMRVNPLPSVEHGDVYVFRVAKDQLSIGLLDTIARVIHKCSKRGTAKLRLETDAGDVIWDEDDILVAPAEFHVLAEASGVLNVEREHR